MSSSDGNAVIKYQMLLPSRVALTEKMQCLSRVPLNENKWERKLADFICVWVVNIRFVVG